MDLASFVSFDAVRAALGVSVDEISDATLSLDLYEFSLVSDLEGINLNLVADFTAQQDAAPESWSSAQTRFHQSVRLFSTYAIAKLAASAMPMFAPKDQTDSKAGLSRFSQDPYKAVIASIAQKFDEHKTKLTLAYGDLNSTTPATAVLRTFFVVSKPTSDPVLGT